MAIFRVNMFGSSKESNQYIVYDEVALEEGYDALKVVKLGELQKLVDNRKVVALPFITTNTNLAQIQMVINNTPNILLGFALLNGRLHESTYTYYGLEDLGMINWTIDNCDPCKAQEIFTKGNPNNKWNKDLNTPQDGEMFITYSLYLKVHQLISSGLGAKISCIKHYINGKYILEISPDPQLLVVNNRYVDNSGMSLAMIDSRFYVLKGSIDEQGRYRCTFYHRGISQSDKSLAVEVAKLHSNSRLGSGLVANMSVSNEVMVGLPAFLQKIANYMVSGHK